MSVMGTPLFVLVGLVVAEERPDVPIEDLERLSAHPVRSIGTIHDLVATTLLGNGEEVVDGRSAPRGFAHSASL